MPTAVHSSDDTDATLDDFCSDDAAMQGYLEGARLEQGRAVLTA